MTEKLLPCMCQGVVEITISEPCDDYPGNAWYPCDATCECSRCGAHPKSIGVRFKTETQARIAIIKHWNSFIENLGG